MAAFSLFTFYVGGAWLATVGDLTLTALLTATCAVLVFAPWLAPLLASAIAGLRSRGEAEEAAARPTELTPLAGEAAIRSRLYSASAPGRQAVVRRGRLRIAMLAPPWIEVPPRGYGGIELVVAHLTDALVDLGHDVILFAPPGSRSRAQLVTPLERPHPQVIGQALEEADHVAQALAYVENPANGRFDLVHDHSGFVALAFADRLATPMLHTLHGPFDERTYGFYARHGHKAAMVAISAAQLRAAPPGLDVVGVIPNPLRVDDWPFRREKEDFLLWIGRMSPVKGPHRAIEVARLAERPLVLAGPVQPGQERFFSEHVEPHIDGQNVRYVGEVGGELKQQLFARAAALLMPIRWPEPFGMVMIEALACGTPVIAFREGSAEEIVDDGLTGFLVADEREMARAVGRLSEIDPERCRSVARERFDVERVARAYESAYRLVVGATTRSLARSQTVPRTRTPRSAMRVARSHSSGSVTAPASVTSRPISTRTRSSAAPAAQA